mmetsp:Transcript_46486/g.132547  ORF Transcript_46486/g.132547 Transcript_46486/m.132547 type:complete len:343 (+) Transcript_46486:87-1115(+)|eukprot:CAMPEP_0168364026 /NCGR_PEP_ID=MMETSP0228-20121227/3995_1 /TAXON_ID=133427 /ORGANISM="Protoceratium reticulatum, Strain CCCM 535 (=CCMP 1889)" /LENGTH=342 /DNA_ID=CAMNT_0008376773 /DNA_START=68 /DNA_END=1096 /DNA_ORIENTATION=-
MIKAVLLSLALGCDALRVHRLPSTKGRGHEVPLSEYERHLLGTLPRAEETLTKNVPRILQPLSVKAGEVPAQLSVLTGQHVVMIGDSITRYQYLNLANHIAYGRAPRQDFFEHSFDTGVPDMSYAGFWAAWYNATNHAISSGEGEEICDCYRKDCCADTFENRYFTDKTRNMSLTYVQWFQDDYTFKGHWSPSMGFPIQQVCPPGLCGPPASWEISQKKGLKQLFQDFVMKLKPTPTHVVMNRAKWGHLSRTQFADLLEEGQAISQKHGIAFIWKTSTHSQNDCCSEAKITAQEIGMARQYGWNVLDLYNLTESIPPDLYNDGLHFKEIVNSYFNNALLAML